MKVPHIDDDDDERIINEQKGESTDSGDDCNDH